MLPRQHSIQHIISAGGASWHSSRSMRLKLSVQVGSHVGACGVQPASLSAHSMPHSVLGSVVVLEAVHAVVTIRSVAVSSHSVVVVRLAALHSVPSVRLGVLRVVRGIIARRRCVGVLGVVRCGRGIVVPIVLQAGGEGWVGLSGIG